ncbi:hypothetical protein MHH56_09525 [Paenibacillus sp. FSL K6-3182]|uniref:hypothetical protein n=1 Tax=Paenibacillus sp. FSL K6-3182 TaxID=2921495 RepID=UPI0030CE4ED0
MIINIQQPLEEEARLLNHLIKQNQWTNKLFTFTPEYRGSRLLMKNISSIHDIFKADEPFAFIYNAVNQPCVIVENEPEYVALINVKSYAAYKQDFLQNDFYTLTTDADYIFALLFLNETYVWTQLAQQKVVKQNNISADEFTTIACKSVEMHLNLFGTYKNHSNLVEYFFHKFSRQFKGIAKFEEERIKMLKPLGYIVGGFL